HEIQHDLAFRQNAAQDSSLSKNKHSVRIEIIVNRGESQPAFKTSRSTAAMSRMSLADPPPFMLDDSFLGAGRPRNPAKADGMLNSFTAEDISASETAGNTFGIAHEIDHQIESDVADTRRDERKFAGDSPSIAGQQTVIKVPRANLISAHFSEKGFSVNGYLCYSLPRQQTRSRPVQIPGIFISGDTVRQSTPLT